MGPSELIQFKEYQRLQGPVIPFLEMAQVISLLVLRAWQAQCGLGFVMQWKILLVLLPVRVGFYSLCQGFCQHFGCLRTNSFRSFGISDSGTICTAFSSLHVKLLVLSLPIGNIAPMLNHEASIACITCIKVHHSHG